MAESLTMNLRLELEKTNTMFNRWADNHEEWLNSNNANHSRQLEECDCTIKALKETDAQLEASKTINESIKRQQLQEIEQCMAQNSLLLKQKQVLEQQLRNCEEDEERENRKLTEARAEHDARRQRMEQSLNDLTYGMRHYMALGLEFQKADGDCMKFIFTQIEESNPQRKCFFVMFVDAQNQYQLVETSPALSDSACFGCISRLNTNNDIAMFVYNMRKLFCEYVKAEKD